MSYRSGRITQEEYNRQIRDEQEHKERALEIKRAEHEIAVAKRENQQAHEVFQAWFLGLCAYFPPIEKILRENPLLPWSLNELQQQKEKIQFMFKWRNVAWTSKQIERKFRRELKTLDEMIQKVFSDLRDVTQVWATIPKETREKMIDHRSKIVKLWELVNHPVVNTVQKIESQIGNLQTTLSHHTTMIREKQNELTSLSEGYLRNALLSQLEIDHNHKHTLEFQIGKLKEGLPIETEMYNQRVSELKTHRRELNDLIETSEKTFLKIITNFREAKKREEQLRKDSEHRKIKIQETEKTLEISRKELSRMVERLSTLEQCRLSLREEYTALFQKSSSDPQLSNFERSLFLKTSDITQLETDVDRLRGKIEMNEDSLRKLLAQETPQ